MQSDFPPVEVCSWEADSQPICISSWHQMQIRGTPGSCCSWWAEVPHVSVGVWVRSLTLKTCWDERRHSVIRKVVSEGELSAVGVNHSLSWKKELVVIALQCTKQHSTFMGKVIWLVLNALREEIRETKKAPTIRKCLSMKRLMHCINLKMVWGTSCRWKMHLNNASICQVFERWET